MKNSILAKSVTRRALIGVAALVLAGVGLRYATTSKLPSTETSATPTVVTIGTFSKALGNAPYHIAKHFGWLEADPAFKGVKLNYVEFNDRPAIASAFSRGELDLLFSAEIPSILIRAQGEAVRLVMVSTFAAQEILVGSGSEIKKVEDLRGRKVAVQAGTSSHFGLVRILNGAGLKNADVNLVFMPAAEGRTAFETSQIDAWAAWAPWVETQEVAGRGRALSGGEAVIYSVGTMREPFLRQYPKQTRALFETMQRAKTWMIANPEEAQKIVAGELGFDLAVVQRAWPKFHWDATLSESLLADFQAKATFLAEQKLTRDNIIVDVSSELVDFGFERKTP